MKSGGGGKHWKKIFFLSRFFDLALFSRASSAPHLSSRGTSRRAALIVGNLQRRKGREVEEKRCLLKKEIDSSRKRRSERA
jgi:hypothetical protein